MARRITIPNSVAPRDTQTAAAELGVHQNTLYNYVREGLVVVPRTRSGRLCWFDPEVEAAREVHERHKQQRAG